MYILWHALCRSLRFWILSFYFGYIFEFIPCHSLSRWVSRYSRKVLSWSYCCSTVRSGSIPSFYLINFDIKLSTNTGGGGGVGGGGWCWGTSTIWTCLTWGLTSVKVEQSKTCCLYSAAARVRAWLSAFNSSHLLAKAYFNRMASLSWFSLSLLQTLIFWVFIFYFPSFSYNFLMRYSF